MRGRLTAGRLFAGRLFGAQASPEIDTQDDIVRHYGGGMNGAPPVTEVIRPRRKAHIPRQHDDQLEVIVIALATVISQ